MMVLVKWIESGDVTVMERSLALELREKGFIKILKSVHKKPQMVMK